MTELDGILALLLVVIVALVWLGSEAKKLRDAVESITESSIGRAVTSL